MPRSEGELFKDKIEVSLDGRQIFYLFFGGAVIASMVFVLGVMVGRRVESRAMSAVGGPQAVASDPLAALDQLEREDTPDLLFPAALRSGDDSDPMEAVDSALSAAPGTGDAKPAADVAEPEAAAGSPQKRDAEPEAKSETPAPAADKPADKDTEAPSAAPETAAAPPSPAAAAAEKTPAKSGRFTLQLSSFQDPGEADAFFMEMKNAGYSPYIVRGEVSGETWYRVRLGHYATYNDAIAAKREFEKAQHIIAYVTRVKR